MTYLLNICYLASQPPIIMPKVLGIHIMDHLRLVLSFLVKISGTQKCKVLISTHGPHWSSEVL